MIDDPSHERTLLPIAIAAATEDDNQFTRLQFAQRFQNIEQRVIRVRVIDEDLELTFRRNSFESTGNLRRFVETQNRFAQIKSETVRRCQRGHGIRDVESSDQRNAHEITLPARIELIGSAAKFHAII